MAENLKLRQYFIPFFVKKFMAICCQGHNNLLKFVGIRFYKLFHMEFVSNSYDSTIQLDKHFIASKL